MRRLVVALAAAATLASCSGSDDEANTDPTVLPPTVPAVVEAAPTDPSAPVAGTLASDGICQVTIPDDWSDDGTARGLTSTGARWTLFGNRLESDTGWLTAVTLLKSQQGSRPGATVDEQPDRVTVTLAENRAVVVRRRLEDRYCELGVTANGTGPVAPETAALWVRVAESLAPIEGDEEPVEE